MREIKFRAIPSYQEDERLENILNKMEEFDGTFIHGYLVDDFIVGDMIEADSEYTILEYWIPIDKKTIGQYTGFKDREGKEIYKGDILKGMFIVDETEISDLGQVYMNNEGQWCVGNINLDFEDILYDWSTENIKIIGNIFENPELLEVKQHEE